MTEMLDQIAKQNALMGTSKLIKIIYSNAKQMEFTQGQLTAV